MSPTSIETRIIAEPALTSTPVTSNESTVTPFATLTTTPPTLTTVEEEASYQNLMVTNGGCNLPCWWGFKLGESLQSVNQKFINRGMPWMGSESSWKVDSDQMGTFRAGYADYYEDEQRGTVAGYRLAVYMEFHELDDSVEYIYINAARTRFEKSQEEFIRDWEQYYLSSFLRKYGKPTQVYFRIRSVGVRCPRLSRQNICRS